MLKVKVSKKLNTFFLNKEWDTKSGEITILFGPSGSGKSITLKAIAGLISPDEGLIQLGDRCLFDSSKQINVKSQERSLGYVPQNFGLFPHMTVLENVAFAMKEIDKDIKKARVLELLKKFEISHISNSYPNEISGGQKQRVAIARAMAISPSILLLDEPFSAIDINLRQVVREEIKFFLQESKIPVVLVSHDYEDVRILATKLIEY